ncbi:MAG: hypothetical protein HY868_20010 [Chloroflexi bacterium]|nr:hypothetical protein [Chloroflexota bacterium]
MQNSVFSILAPEFWIPQRDPTPEEFTSIEQAAEFWETHDLTDYEDVWHEVDFKVNLKHKPGLKVALDPQIANEFTKRARAKRVRVDTLVNRAPKDYLSRAA